MSTPTFLREKGKAAPLPANNIDTDVIMPKQFLKTLDREGLAKGAFFDLRFDDSGDPNPDFVLNQPCYKSSKFLVTGENFGCGSSREHAVWGLLQLGIKAIIAPSFAGIFFDNAEKNGLLLIQLSEENTKCLMKSICRDINDEIVIDLEKQCIESTDNTVYKFTIEPLRRSMIMNGYDRIDQTISHEADIDAFEHIHYQRFPWLKK